MSLNKLWYLKQIDLFKTLKPEDLVEIASLMQEKQCMRKELLYSPHGQVDHIYLLKKGEITIYYAHKGKKLILDVLKPGSLFGNLSFQENKSPHFAEVSKEAFLCVFSKKNFTHIFSKHPELVLRLFQYTSERLGEYEEKMRGALFSSKEKVFNQLKLLSKKQQRFFKLFKAQKIFISHVKLSEHTGLSRETVTRALQELKKEGCIEVDDKGGILISSLKNRL